MPLYDYACQSCGKTTEILQRYGDPPLALCPHCGGPLKKLVSAPAFQFKGTGWYVTDYGKGGSGGGKGSGSGAGSGSEGGDSAASSSKSESKSESKGGDSSPAASDKPAKKSGD